MYFCRCALWNSFNIFNIFSLPYFCSNKIGGISLHNHSENLDPRYGAHKQVLAGIRQFMYNTLTEKD